MTLTSDPTSAPPGATPGDWETLDRLARERWSCRAFTDREVPRATIEAILDVARRTPSWCNTQPWELHVLSGTATQELRAALAAALAAGAAPCPDVEFPPSYEGEYGERRRRSGWQLYEALGVEKGDRAASMREMLKNFEFFGAPHVAILTGPRSLGTYGALDCGLFLQSFLLAAQSLGVAAIPQAALAAQSPVLRAHLGLPEDRLVLVGVSFGYADLDHPANSYRTERATLDTLTTWHDGIGADAR